MAFNKNILTFSFTSAAVTVMIGAFGAHYLKTKVAEGILTTDNLQSFETGVRYQMYHTLSLILIVLLSEKLNERFSKIACRLFIIGIILFSGSVYLLSTQALTGLSLKWLGPVTPLGGLCFISGWILLLLAVFKTKPE